MATLQPLAPALLDHIVTTCLAKDADARWQSAADVAHALKWSLTPSAAPGRMGVRSAAGLWSGAAAATAIIAAAVMLAWPRLRPEPSAASIVRFPLVAPPNATFVGTPSSVPVIQVTVSPDGRHLVFGAVERDQRPMLWLRTLDNATAVPLAGTENGQDPFWSPDSQSIGFFAAGRLKRIDVATNRVQDITETSFSHRGGSWGPDGTIIFGDANGGLSRVSAQGGTASTLTGATETISGRSQRWPMFLPDGRHYLYFARGLENDRGVYVGSLDGGPPKRVLDSPMSAVYANGYLLAIRSSSLFAFPFDTDRLEVTGEPTLITSQIGGSSTQQAPMSVSQTGVLAYGLAARGTNQLQWFDRDGRPHGAPLATGTFVNFSLSPDEGSLLLSKVDPQTNSSDLWLLDLRRPAAPTRLTLDPMNDMGPVWSPDGRRFVFRSDRFGGNFLFGVSLDGGAAKEEVITRTDTSNPTDWSADGTQVIFHNTASQSGSDIGAVQMPGGVVQPVLRTRYNEYDGRLSSDGKWIAYVSEESGAPEVYVQSYPPTGRKMTISTNGGSEPRWRKDGRELFYLDRQRRLMSVAISTRGELRPAAPTPLFQTRVSATPTSFRSQLAVTGDGQRFLLNIDPSEGGNSEAVTVVLNWTAALPPR
jgi:Tol biopolymer transport system component